MFVHNIDPVIFSIGPLAIRWYGLVYVAGFIALYLALRKLGDLEQQQADSLTLWLAIGMLLGARSFFFAFYRPDLFSITEFFALWNGGMSFHGGLLGALGAGWLWSKRNEVSVWRIADVGALIAAFFLALGRLANFANAEIYGTRTDVWWCVQFPGVDGCRHPTQLYAFVKDIAIGSALVWLWRRNTFREGFMFWSFTFLYSILRFTVNFWRDDPILAWGWLKMGHLLTVALFAVASVMLWARHREDLHKVYKA